MTRIKQNWFRRLIALSLAIASLLQWLPANAIAVEGEPSAGGPIFQPGDVNEDGFVNALDVTLMRRYIVGESDGTINTLAADVNCDGFVNSKDVHNLRRYIVGGYGIELISRKESSIIKFETGNGTPMADAAVKNGTLISTLATPYWAEHIFLYWCYDAALTQPVASTDTVAGDMTLYASWLEQAPLDTLDEVHFASAEDVSSSFTIGVVASDAGMTAEEVRALIVAEDLTDPDARNIIAVSGGGGVFTISGINGFKPGASYRITLGSDKLTFQNQPASARQFNFTVHRDEVMNLTMKSDIHYLPLGSVSNLIADGRRVSSLDLALYQTNGTTVTAGETAAGSFVYTEDAAIEVGDIVCIYDGAIPTSRTSATPKDQLGDVAYLKIIGISGSTYQYESAEAEEVLFIPDVLPMPADADTDDSETTVTVDNKYLDYSADLYAYMNLDSQTTVDVGDFFAFYAGDLGIESGENAATLGGYGKITQVTENDDGTTTISYIVVSWNEVKSCMDVYTEEAMTASEMLEGVDIRSMESEIEQQAIDSGFVEEAAQYMASLALATENFSELSENLNLEDYKVALTDGTPVSPEQLQLMSDGVNVTIKEKTIKATVSKKPTHLGNLAGTNADEKGIAITLDVTVVLHISSDESGQVLEIAITGSFVEELGVDFTASADAIWDWAVIIPYISDIKVSTAVDTLNYTGVSFNATMVSKDKNNTSSAMDIANEIKALLKSMTDGGIHSDDNQEKLIQSYQKLVSTDTDWVKVVDQNITTIKRNLPLEIPLININFTVDFVIYMDAALSVGFDFQYIEGKRHVFTMSIKERSAYSDTIDLLEKAYQFSFYSLGRINMKVGVELGFSISVFTPKLGSVGFEAGAGAYTNLYGYFYYELRYTQSKGKDVQYSGALLIQVGVYLDFGLVAQALNNRYTARANLFEKQWKLYEVGRRDNVLDFATEQEDVPEIVMKQFVRQVQLPDSFFNMDYLDLITGESKNAIYNDWYDPERDYDFRNGENYVITMTNDKFTYDPTTNTIAVHAEEDEMKITGEMIVTWRKQPMSFSSKAISRTVSLYWDNLRDGYLIVPYTNGGSYVPIIIKNYEEPVTAPADPEKLGYTFAGWYSDSDLTIPYQFPEIMPNTDTSIYAKWAPRSDIPYTVEHYQENFRSGEYELAETETFLGTTDSCVTPSVKRYTGYITPAQAQIKVEADGSAVLRYYYTLERHNVTFDSGRIDGADVANESDVTYNLKYGASIRAPQMAMNGYTFVGWSVDGATATNVASVMGTTDLTYTALWAKNADTPYRIEYYVQQIDGRYTLQYLIWGETVTGNTFTEDYLRNLTIDGMTAEETFAVENAIVFENVTVKGIVCTEAAVDGSGKTVIKVNYGRQKHTLTFDLNYEGAEPIVKDVFYGTDVIAPQNVTRPGYTFAGWEVTPVQTMPAENLTYRAVWTPNTYTVRFHSGHDAATGEMADQSFVYDAEQALVAQTFVREHYDFAGWSTQQEGNKAYEDQQVLKNLTEEANGQVDLYALWKPTEYTITYHNVDLAVCTNPDKYNVETETFALTAPVRTGYDFAGWYADSNFETEVTQITKGSSGHRELYAKWTARNDISYKVEHYQQQLDESYTLADVEALTGTADAQVTPSVKNYEGFSGPAAQQITVAADGTTVVRYYYYRNTYTLTFEAGEGYFPDVPEPVTEETVSDEELEEAPIAQEEPEEALVNVITITALYGEEITIPVPVREGYGFGGWYHGDVKFETATMPAEDLTLTAQWNSGEYAYTVNHYKQNLDGTDYTLAETEKLTGLMDQEVTPETKTYEGFTAPSELVTIVIGTNEAGNVVDYYYTRNQYTLTWDFGGGSANGQTSYSEKLYYGAPITAPVPEMDGYHYAWDTIPATVMPATDLSYTAIWSINVYHVSFQLSGGTVVSGTAEPRTLAYGQTYGELPVLEKAGYTFEGWFDGDAEITAETVLNKMADHTLTAKFSLITYGLTYHGVEAGTHSNPAAYSTEDGIVLNAPDSRMGYTFSGWYASADFSGEAVTRIEKGETGEKSFYAKWTENTYTVVFQANNGTAEEVTRSILYTGTLMENTFQHAGYTFLGWTDGANTYTADTQLSQILTAGMNTVYLRAVWQKQRYTITYVGVESGEHSNATEYTVDDAVSLGAPNDRVGYTFQGWYDNSAFEGTPVATISAGSSGHKMFYAKWDENTYTVQLHANDGTGLIFTTEPILYTGVVPGNAFARAGYRFLGWATTPSGEKAYDDAVAISQIIGHANGNNQITLYAVWELAEYTITYNLGSHAASTTHNNPTTYSLALGADIVLEDLTPKSGFQFGGWYTNPEFTGSKVTTIACTDGTDYNLYAKWEHAGTFSISQTSVSGYKVTYTVKRTIPDGAVGTTANQTVYVRTQNGTAYGTTTDSYGQDKYHFIHNYAVLTFGPNDTSKTFVVTEKDDYLENYVTASYTIGSKARNYYVEIYKVENTSGGLVGTIGTGRITRTMPVSSYKLTTSMYRWYSYTGSSSATTVTDSGYSAHTVRKFNPTDAYNSSASSNEKAYRDIVSDKYSYRVSFDIREINDGYQWLRISTVDPSGKTSLRAEYIFATKDGQVASDWGRNVVFPNMGTGYQGADRDTGILFDVGDCEVTEKYTMYNDNGTKYAVIGSGNTIKLEFDASGNKDDDWQYRNLKFEYKMHDKSKPAVQYAAPLATTAYKKGDTAYITIIYNEPINSISGTPTLSLASSTLGKYFQNPTYVSNGTGTNALVFKVTAKKDITADEIQNTVNRYLAFPVSGIGGTFASNIGTVTATVKDILGNG